jgi:hypothetical protein
VLLAGPHRSFDLCATALRLRRRGVQRSICRHPLSE